MKGKIAVLLITVLLVSGCYMNHVVETSKMAVRTESGRVKEIAGPGRYTDWFFADIIEIDVSAKTSEWTDLDLVTKDKQPIGLTIGVTYSRDRDKIEFMWERYNQEARDDKALETQVLKRIPGVAKDLTAHYTLDQMLGIGEGAAGRQHVTSELMTNLAPELEEVGIELLNVTVNNISYSETYMKLLESKANAQAETEVAREQTKQLAEQLKQEQAQTLIDMELARRAQQVAEETAKTYTISPQAYALKRLELLAKVFGSRDKIFFVEPGTDVTLLFDAENIVPLPQEED